MSLNCARYGVLFAHSVEQLNQARGIAIIIRRGADAIQGGPKTRPLCFCCL